MQVLGSFGQEPIIVSEEPWSVGYFCDVNYLGCPSLNLTFVQPNGTAVFWLTYPCLVLLSILTRLASTVSLSMIFLVVTDSLGPVRRDGLSLRDPTSLCRPPPLPSRRKISCRVLVQASSCGRSFGSLQFSSRSWCPSVGLSTVLNCMFALVGTLARALLVAPDGFTFLGREQLPLGLSARALLCLYAQDPVARVLSRCVFFLPPVSLRLTPSLHVSRGV